MKGPQRLLTAVLLCILTADLSSLRMETSRLTPQQRDELAARQVRVRSEHERSYRLCRCTECCSEGLPHLRNNWVYSSRPSAHVRKHGLGTNYGHFNHFTEVELYNSHLHAMLSQQVPSERSSPRTPAPDQHSPTSNPSRNTSTSGDLKTLTEANVARQCR